MGWFPTWSGETVTGPKSTFVAGSETFRGTFPVNFTFDLRGPPPAEALIDLAATGGHGKYAFGFLVAFEDGNGNERLDPGATGAPSPDRIVGVSEADLSLPPPLHHYFVLYLDGTPAEDDYLASFMLEQGYTLVEVHSDYGVQVVPPETSVGIEVTRTDALQFFGCAEASFTPWYQTACGIDPYGGKYRITRGALDGRLGTQLEINDGNGSRGDATVLLNGTALTFDPVSAMYTGDRPVVGANTLQIDVPGYPTETITANVPGPVILTTQLPTDAPSGTRLTLGWSDDPAVELYDVLIFGADDFRPLFFANVNASSITTDRINYFGKVRVIVKGLAPLAVGSNGGFVTPLNRFDGYLTLMP
jgi:hypothetical protein